MFGKRTLGILILLLATACTASRSGMKNVEPPAPAAELRSNMVVDTEWLAAHIEDADIIVLHVAHERAHYDGGHIPGAVFLDANRLYENRKGIPNQLPPASRLVEVFTEVGVGDSNRIILYGDRLGLTAARTFFTLDYLGHADRTAVLDGGLEKWRREKKEISHQSVRPRTAAFSPRIQSEIVLAFPQMADYSWAATQASDSGLLIVDARPPDEFKGTTPGDAIKRPGHIPGAVNIYWRWNIREDEPLLRSVEALRASFEKTGVKPGGKVIAYCRTGVQASHAWFTARYLGYDALLYDGSFFEWNAEDVPVER